MAKRLRSSRPEYQKYEFDVDYNTINSQIWKAVRDNVIAGINSLVNVLIPYCEENKLVESVISPDYGSKKCVSTKNWKFFLYKHKHENMKVFMHAQADWTTMYVLVSYPKYDPEDMVGWERDMVDKVKDLKNTFMICVNLTSKYSDDEYCEARQAAVDNILEHIAGTSKSSYYSIMIWNSAAVKRDEEKVEIRQVINTRQMPGELADGWMRDMFELSCDFHYLDQEQD